MGGFLLEREGSWGRGGKGNKGRANQHHFEYWFDKGHHCVICLSRIFVDMGGFLLEREGSWGRDAKGEQISITSNAGLTRAISVIGVSKIP